MITSKDVTIEGGEDKGKTFVVTKMALIPGDRWANRVALALLKAGVDISGLTSKSESGEVRFSGMLNMVGIINVALKALGGVDDEVAQSLLDELLRNVQLRLPNGSVRPVLVDTDIQSIETLWKIRIEAIKVNLDFLAAGVTQ